MFYQPAQGQPLPRNPFKAIVSPRPIGWISTVNATGQANLAPYSFFNAICDAPPMVMFASTGNKPDQDAYKDTVANIRATGEFVVNMVSHDLRSQMNKTSAGLAADIDEFEKAGLARANCNLVKPPRVANAPASLECKLFQLVELPGDSNVMVIGSVIGVHMADWTIKDGKFDVTSFNPLARLGYMDYTTVTDIYPMERPEQEQ